MSLNIKSERVHALARQAAELTGTSQTGAIEQALRLLLDQYGADPEQAHLDRRLLLARAAVAAYQADPGDPAREIARVEDLYDERSGLPR